MNFFLKWSNKDYTSLLLLPDDQLQILLEDFMLYCKKRYKKRGIETRIAAIEKFLFINDRIINKKKLNMFLPEIEKNKLRAITTDEIQRLLKKCGDSRNNAIIHIFAATGCRPEALVNIRLKDLAEMPGGCTSIVLYTDSKNELITFCHAEATKAINEYLDERRENETLNPDSFLIRRKTVLINTKPEPLSVSSLSGNIAQIMDKAKIVRIEIYEGRYDLPVCGGFRKRFNTIFKMNPNISYTIAEMFMDHHVRYELNYTKPTKEQLFEEYKKAIPQLTVDDSIRNQQELDKVTKEKIQLEKTHVAKNDVEEMIRNTVRSEIEKLILKSD